MVTVSAMATTLFLGGWRAPWPLSSGSGNGWLAVRWPSSSRCCIFLFVFIWLRGTLPRLRYDQFMRLGWKVLVPVNLVWILRGLRAAHLPHRRSGDVTGVLLHRGRHRVVASCWSVAFLVPGPAAARGAGGRAGVATTRCRRWTSWSPTRPARRRAVARRPHSAAVGAEAGARRPGRHRRRRSPARHRLLDRESE